MARFHKRLTRKDIRQPDKFVTLTGQLLEVARSHKITIAASLTALLVIALGLWGFQLYRQHQNRLAAQNYSRALALYREGRYRESLDAIERLNSLRWARFRNLGMIYRANAYLALDEPQKAAVATHSFLETARNDPILKQLGLLTLAYAQERSGQCKDGFKSYSEAEKLPGAFREEGLLGKARCALQLNEFKNALESYRRYLREYPESERATEITLRIRELEAQQRGSQKDG